MKLRELFNQHGLTPNSYYDGCVDRKMECENPLTYNTKKMAQECRDELEEELSPETVSTVLKILREKGSFLFSEPKLYEFGKMGISSFTKKISVAIHLSSSDLLTLFSPTCNRSNIPIPEFAAHYSAPELPVSIKTEFDQKPPGNGENKLHLLTQGITVLTLWYFFGGGSGGKSGSNSNQDTAIPKSKIEPEEIQKAARVALGGAALTLIGYGIYKLGRAAIISVLATPIAGAFSFAVP